MQKNILLVLFGLFSISPIFIGLAFWIIGRAKNNKKMRHNGFVIMMLSLLIIAVFVFSIAATLFYTYLVNKV